jgi:hypothetical protein
MLPEKNQEVQADNWTIHKWWLIVSVAIVFVYGIACLICAVITWVRSEDISFYLEYISKGVPVLPQADVVYTADGDVLTLATFTGSLLIFSAFIGMAGIILNSRPLLATYTIFLWPSLISMVAIGFATYKRSTFALDHKLDLAWSQWYTPKGRLMIQDALHCCGFYDALHEAIPSKRCYPRTSLPGCKGSLYRFEKKTLEIISSAMLSLVLLHILNIIVALLCANHITNDFGDGMMPKKYRLSTNDIENDGETGLLYSGRQTKE